MSLPAIGMMLGATTATAAATGATVLGSVLSGVGAAWSASSARKAEEKSRIAEENRRSARYEGLGQSTRYWDNTNKQTGTEMTTQSIAAAPALGKRPDQIGSKYAQPTQPMQNQQPKARWRFDPATGQIGKS